MASKQGGKGKQSSASRTASHKRAAARSALKKPGPIPDFPKHPLPRPKESVVFSGQVRKQTDDSEVFPVHFVVCNGVTLEASSKQSEAIAAVSGILPGLPYRHFTVNPLGKQTVISARGFE